MRNQPKKWEADGVELSAADQQKLNSAITLNAQLKILERKKTQLTASLTAAFRDETRARENLAVNKVDKQYGQKVLEDFQQTQDKLTAVRLAIQENEKLMNSVRAKKQALVE